MKIRLHLAPKQTAPLIPTVTVNYLTKTDLRIDTARRFVEKKDRSKARRVDRMINSSLRPGSKSPPLSCTPLGSLCLINHYQSYQAGEVSICLAPLAFLLF